MVATTYTRGHKIFYDEKDKQWKYQEDTTDINLNEKPCIKCGEPATITGADHCLKGLEDTKCIISACCGHGVQNGYIILDDGRIFTETKDRKFLDNEDTFIVEKEYNNGYNDVIIDKSCNEYYETMQEACKLLNNLSDEITRLHNELKSLVELLYQYKGTVKHQAGLLADASKNGYFPPIPEGATFTGKISEEKKI